MLSGADMVASESVCRSRAPRRLLRGAKKKKK